MYKKIILIAFFLTTAYMCNAQVVDIKELTMLFDIPIKLLEKKIDTNKWKKVIELKNEEGLIYSTDYRINSLSNVESTKIRIVEYLKGPPKILLFMTAEKKTIAELDNEILATKFNLVETNNKNGAVDRIYMNGQYLYIYSKAEATSVLLITTSKEYLEDKKINSNNPT
ncbi:hypothetical protein [Pedobacter boryungensis]|uniref:DUF4358 domain-containing protein n=1 Tax=Pedobacter boryungensis TaxID=869962 RepID=A0ABX2DA64_9SPHI|nr:hypothetical protein [Pedobacter boryungensis]NQX30870.1 hypothetical protein [Pedobacter boryungensis]